MLRKCALISLPVLTLFPGSLLDERAGIERAVLDYAESYYEVREDYAKRGIHRDLVKLGFKRGEDESYEAVPMDYDGFLGMVRWLEENDQTPEPGPKTVEILDALDQTALVKLTGSWGVDYMQLARFDGKWMTRHVLWQTAPTYVDEEQRLETEHAVEKAVENYLESIYRAKPKWMERSVDKGLTKYGFSSDKDGGYEATAMSFDQLVEGAGKWYAGSPASESARRSIEVLDVMDKTACVKLTADWGIDYMNLAEIDGRWMILQVMWQSHPRPKSGS